MKQSLLSVLISMFMAAGLVASPAVAQDKAKAEKGKAVQKVLHDDDRVRVTETTFKPGDVGPNSQRGFRVSRFLQGGTLERNFADGKKESAERKTGQVLVQEPDKQAYANKNVGKTEIVIYTVNIKQPKK